MTKKRRAARSKLGLAIPTDPKALHNEVLALLFGGRPSPVEAQIRRVRQRHPALSEQEAAQVVCECRQALETSYAIVSAALTQGESQVHAAGRIMQAFPWIASRHVDALCAWAFLLAK